MHGIITILPVCLPFIIITPLSASHLFSLPLATFLSVYHHISTRLYFPSLTVSFRTVFGNRSSARIPSSSEQYSANLPAARRPRTTDGPRRSREPNHYNACESDERRPTGRNGSAGKGYSYYLYIHNNIIHL